jgi:hypothetical protein
MQHHSTTTRLVDLFIGGNHTNFYIISHHQILFKKIKRPKIKGLSPLLLACKNDEKDSKVFDIYFFQNVTNKGERTVLIPFFEVSKTNY